MVIVTLALSAACSSSGSDGVVPLAAPADTSGEPAPPTTTRPDEPVVTTISPWNEEQLEVIAAFEAGLMAFRVAGEDPSGSGWDQLARTHAPEALEADRALVRRRESEGTAVRWPRGVAVNGVYGRIEIVEDEAELYGCYYDDGVLYSVVSGQVLDSSAGSRSFRGLARRADGRWLYRGYETLELRLGGDSC